MVSRTDPGILHPHLRRGGREEQALGRGETEGIGGIYHQAGQAEPADDEVGIGGRGRGRAGGREDKTEGVQMSLAFANLFLPFLVLYL